MKSSKTQREVHPASESRDQMTILIDRLSEGVFADETTLSLMDNEFKAALSKAFNGMSPIEICLAYLDWLIAR